MRRTYPALLASGLLALVPSLFADERLRGDPLRFKLLIGQSGVYRVTHGDLVAAGLEADARPGSLRLTHRDRSVPLWDRRSGELFGPGDDFVFRAERLAGEHSYYHEHSQHNVYVLELDGGAGSVAAHEIPREPPTSASELELWTLKHLERDRLLHRFSRRQSDPRRDDWFWRRMTHIDPEPTEIPLDLHDLRPGGSVRLRLAVRGWSQPVPALDGPEPDHVLEVRFNDVLVARGAWDRQDETRIVVDPVPTEAVHGGENRLRLTVPPRAPEGAEDALIDVSLLDWIEVEYERDGRLARAQESLRHPAAPGWIAITPERGARALAFTESGRVLHPAPGSAVEQWLRLPQGEGSGESFVVVEEGFHAPDAIQLDRPSAWRSPENRADYLMIAHPDLIEAVRPLADFHRSRGLAVEVVDVVDVYDEFRHGIVDPGAIRDFVAHAYHSWTKPAPRFVLLVGDASWDTKNLEPRSRNYVDWTYRPGEIRQGRRNQITHYPDGARRDRNLIPTGRYDGAQGHAASDNYFVTVDGDDDLPDLAIGRLPVTEPEEVRAIVEKTVGYMTETEPGPWQRNILWISNESRTFQERSEELARLLEERGFASTKVFPSSTDDDNRRHQQALLDSIDQGQLLIHFLGHGGRYIWRTGPPDFGRNHDLFTLDHLDALEPTRRLPVVLSMTCYSAPFDHPTADSIGEKFLRLADRGAVAVLAASWRNSPSTTFSRQLLLHLTSAPTLGEAILGAKRLSRRPDLIETYNLLGDPAVELAVEPALRGASGGNEPGVAAPSATGNGA